MDFSSELSLVQLKLANAKLTLALMEPDTPSNCPCGRSANAHVEDNIEVLVALEQLFSGQPASFLSFIAPGPEQLVYAAHVMISSSSESMMEWAMNRMMSAVEAFVPAAPEENSLGNPGATARNNFGRYN